MKTGPRSRTFLGKKDKTLAAPVPAGSEILERGGSQHGLFCIHNTKVSGCVGNCITLWRVDGCGYTVDLDDAWKLTMEQAQEICRTRPQEDFPVSYALLNSLAKRHVDIQGLREAMGARRRTSDPNPASQPNSNTKES